MPLECELGQISTGAPSASSPGDCAVGEAGAPVHDRIAPPSRLDFQDRYAAYGALRAGGMSRLELFGGACVVGRHQDCVSLLRDRRLSVLRSSALFEALTEQERLEFGDFSEAFSRWMIFLEGTEHRILRHGLQRLFSRSTAAGLRTVIADCAETLLAEGEAAGGMDLVRGFADLLPVAVMARMLNLPAGDAVKLSGWSTDIARFFGAPVAELEIVRRGRDALAELTGYLTRSNAVDHLFAELNRLGTPADDLERLRQSEGLAEAQCAMLLFAGHETTRNLIGNACFLLLTNRSERIRLQEHPSLMSSAVQEVLRLETPVQIASRVALEAIPLGEGRIEAGELVLLLLGSANRDPAAFDRPEEFDVGRRPNHHIAFGYGPRSCLGAQLASLEAELALAAILKRLPRLKRLDQEPAWEASFGFRGLSALPVVF